MTNILNSLINARIPLKNNGLTDRIGMILIGVSLVIILLTMSLFVLYIKQKRHRDLNTEGWILTSMVAGYPAKGLDREEANKLLSLVSAVERERGLVSAMIMDADRRVIAHTDPRFVDTVLTDPAALTVASSTNFLRQVYTDPGTNRTIHDFSRPIFHDNKQVGAVRLAFSEDIKPLLSESDIRGLFFVGVLFFSLVPLAYYLMRRSFSSLMYLDDELKYSLKKKEFREIRVDSGGWLGEFVERFNQVICYLKDKYNALHASHENIEVANKVLSYEKDRIESVLDNLQDGIMVTDSMGSVILVNRKMGNMMKFSKQDVLGTSINDCFRDEEIKSFIKRNQFYGSSFSQKNMEIALKEADGEIVLRISHLPLLNSEESVLGNIIVARDITADRIAAQSQTDFIAHVSHELRTPLTTIKSYVEMLMDDEVNDRESRIDFYNTINDEANRLARLIGNLLNISKIEMGNLTINRDLIKSKEFFQDILKSIESQAVSKKIKLESILPDKLSSLVMDKDLLQVAVLNVLGNAIKYTPPEGSVTFRVEEDEGAVTIDIVDTGYGISEEELPHIFDKFFRSCDEKIKAHTGNGLGLALCREIIRLHNGKVNVVSNPGQGTHFTITLPLEESPRIHRHHKTFSSLIDQ